MRTSEEVTACLADLEELTGKPFPFYTLSIDHIRTKRDVERLRRRTRISAMHSMFALISDAIRIHHLMENEDLQYLFQKAYDISKGFHDVDITLLDLQWVLEEEYGLCLTMHGTNIMLERIEQHNPQVNAQA